MSSYSSRGRTRSAGTSCAYPKPIPAEYLTEALQAPSGQRTHADCRPGHHRPSRSTRTARGGSNTRRSGSSSSTATTVGARTPSAP